MPTDNKFPKNSKLQKTIERVLSKQFNDLKIVAVNVRPDFDHYGDRIITIKVIYDGSVRDLDLDKRVSIGLDLLPEMRGVGEEGFPVTSFIARSDLGKVSPETV